ncbi:MAG TPA: ABC transporter ATP-binding protein, partial [Herpetosiphonaceae bacterium]
LRVLGDPEPAAELAAGAPGVFRVLPPEPGERELVLEFEGGDDEAAALLGKLAAAGVAVADFHRENDNLERLFLRLVNGEEVAA